MRVLIDTREPDPHPWVPHLPAGWTTEQGTLETGDLALVKIPEGVVIERKTTPDLLGCIGRDRERFERELRRGRYVGRFIVVVEGTLADLLTQSRGLRANAVTGTLAAWTTRFCPVVFAGSTKAAADFAFRCLAAQVRQIERDAAALRVGS